MPKKPAPKQGPKLPPWMEGGKQDAKSDMKESGGKTKGGKKC